MPTLASLLENGCHGVLESVVPFETSPAWSSFQTGCFPTKTGVFAFHSVDSLYKNIILNSFNNISVPSIWEIANKADKKVVCINMPMTSPPPKINGVIIPGLTCPELSSETVWPSDIYDRYLKKYPGYRIVNKDKQDSLKDYVQAAIQTEQMHCDLSLQIMADIDWDIFCVQVQSTDFFQHRNWWSIDSSSEGYTEEAFRIASSFYNKIDSIIKQLVTSAGEETLLCIASDHGFCGMKAEFGINTWLADNGYLALQTTKSGSMKMSLKEKFKKKIPLIKNIAKLQGKIYGLIASLKKQVKSELYAEKVMRHIREIIDLEKTEAFCLGGLAGLLYLNPKKAQSAAEIIDKLLIHYGPKSSCPLIADIRRTEDVYQLNRREPFFPDYIILFAEGVSNHIQPDGKIVIKDDVPEKQSGTHDPNGMFLFSGKEIQICSNINAGIVDVAPTLLAYLDIPVPNHMDGRVLCELFEPHLKPTYIDYDISCNTKGSRSYSDEEQSVVEKQLKDLGYL